MARKYNPYKRVYYDRVKKAISEHKKLSVTGASVTVFLLWYLVFVGAITVTYVSGDMHCGLDKQDCIAEIHFCALKDVYIYPNESWNFYTDTPIEDLRFQRSWGSSWRTINLSKPWSTQVKYAVKFAMGQCYEVRYLITKSPWEEVKWGFGDVDPVFKSFSSVEDVKVDGKNTKKITFKALTESYNIRDLADTMKIDPEELLNITISNHKGKGNVSLMVKRNVTENVTVDFYDCNCRKATMTLPDMTKETVDECDVCHTYEDVTTEKLVELDLDGFVLNNKTEIYEVFHQCDNIEWIPELRKWGCEAWTDINILQEKVKGATWQNATWGFRQPINVNFSDGDPSEYAIMVLLNGTSYFDTSGLINDSKLDGNGNCIQLYNSSQAGAGILAWNFANKADTSFGFNTSTAEIWFNSTTTNHTSYVYYDTDCGAAGDFQDNFFQTDSALIAWWHKAEGTGSYTNDSAKVIHNGTLVGATWTSGKIGGAIDYDGSASYTTVPDHADWDTDNFTVEMWVYRDATCTDQFPGIWSKGFNQYFLSCVQTSNVLRGYIWTGAFPTVNGPAITLNTWVHVAHTYNDSSHCVWTNGVSVCAALATTITTDSNPVTIGTYSTSDFPGKIDEITMSNLYRSPNWIKFRAEPDKQSLLGAEESAPAVDNPPVSTLISPADKSTDTDGNITFNCTCNDDNLCINITLWHNASGTMSKNQTKAGSADYLQFDFYKNLVDHDGETILWTCSAGDNASQFDFPAANWTVDIDLTPEIVLLYINGTQADKIYELGYQAWIVGNSSIGSEVCINISGVGENLNCSDGEVTYNFTATAVEWMFNDSTISTKFTSDSKAWFEMYDKAYVDSTSRLNFTGQCTARIGKDSEDMFELDGSGCTVSGTCCASGCDCGHDQDWVTKSCYSFDVEDVEGDGNNGISFIETYNVTPCRSSVVNSTFKWESAGIVGTNSSTFKAYCKDWGGEWNELFSNVSTTDNGPFITNVTLPDNCTMGQQVIMRFFLNTTTRPGDTLSKYYESNITYSPAMCDASIDIGDDNNVDIELVGTIVNATGKIHYFNDKATHKNLTHSGSTLSTLYIKLPVGSGFNVTEHNMTITGYAFSGEQDEDFYSEYVFQFSDSGTEFLTGIGNDHDQSFTSATTAGMTNIVSSTDFANYNITEHIDIGATSVSSVGVIHKYGMTGTGCTYTLWLWNFTSGTWDSNFTDSGAQADVTEFDPIDAGYVDASGVIKLRRQLYALPTTPGTSCFGDLHELKVNFTSRPTNVKVDIGQDGKYEFNYTDEVNRTYYVSNYSAFNDYLASSDCTGTSCDVPIDFISSSAGILGVGKINISYDFNPSFMNVTAINDILNQSASTTHDVALNVTAKQWGELTAKELFVEFYGSANFTVYAITNTSITDNSKLSVTYSNITVRFPPNVYWYSYIPENSTAWNVTPFGQSDTQWAMNITTLNYGDEVDVSLRLNATPDGCRHLFIATNNNIYNANNMTTARWIPIEDSQYGNDTSFWFWMNATNCNNTVGWFDDYLFIEPCCAECTSCW